MFKAVTCIGVVVSASISPFVVSAQTTGADCVTIEHDIARLECFDNAFSNKVPVASSISPYNAYVEFIQFSPLSSGISTNGVGQVSASVGAKATNVYADENNYCNAYILDGGFRPGFYHGTFLLEYNAYSIDLSKVQSYQLDSRVNGFAISMQRDESIGFEANQFEGIGGDTLTMFGQPVGQQTQNSKSLELRTMLVPFVLEPEDVPKGAEYFSQWIDACTGNN